MKKLKNLFILFGLVLGVCFLIQTDTFAEESISDSHTHTITTTIKQAKPGANGQISYTCKECGVKMKDSVVIYAPKSVETVYQIYPYGGSAIVPKPIVKDVKGNRISSAYYTLSYKNNIETGCATVIVTFKDRYAGAMSRNFTIRMRTPTVKSSTTYGTNTISWNKITGADGYQISRSKSANSGFTIVKTIWDGSTVKYTDNVAFGSTYYYRVRTFHTYNGQNYFSEWSGAVKRVNELAQGVVYTADRMSETSVNIYVLPVTKADGYRIYRSTTLGSGYVYVGETKRTSWNTYLDTGKSANTTYYYKTRAYRVVNGVTYFGAYSKPVKAETWKESRLYYLFPNGLPKTQSQMSQYLTTITVPVKDASGNKSTKKLTVHKKLADKYKAIFQEMYDANIPVRKSDTGGYNWRTMTTSSLMSHHSYGCVIDLNWGSNPFVKYGKSSYSAGYKPGVDPYSVTKKCVDIWKKYGFYWGGDWKMDRDYMHFTYTNH